MTIKDVESRTGLGRANVRFYEREGLLSPVRAENGYRDYSEEDVQILLRVKLLRQVRLTLEEIKALQAGTLELAEALRTQIEALEREQEAAGSAQRLCSWIMEDGAAFQTLDAEKYLRQLPEPAGAAYAAADMEPQAFCPWRRYFARSLDLMLYSTVFDVIFCLAAGIPIQNMNRIASAIASMALMLVIEPLLLRCCGTTPGKFCFGLSIESAEGGRLSYRDAFERTAGALYVGMAFQVPLLGYYTLWKSYKRCVSSQCQPWEEEHPVNYSFRYGNGGCALRAAAAMALVFVAMMFGVGVQRMAPNRGELTIAEYAENVNHIRRYYFKDVQYELDESGQWVRLLPEGAVVIDLGGENITRSPLDYTMDGGSVTGVSFSLESSGGRFSGLPTTEMALLTMGLLGAEKEAGFLSNTLVEVGNQILKSGYSFADRETNEFTLSQYGVTVSWTLTQHGYRIYDSTLWGVEDDTDDYGYSLSFRVERA